MKQVQVATASGTAGFTLVELLACIMLVGILSATFMARISSGSANDASAVRNQIIAMARSAQQASIGHRDVELSLQQAGNALELRIDATTVDGSGTETLQQNLVPARGLSLGGDVNITQSCASQAATSLAAPMQLVFVWPGRLASGGAGALQEVTSAARICINGAPEMSVCISTAGFAYAGDCDDDT